MKFYEGFNHKEYRIHHFSKSNRKNKKYIAHLIYIGRLKDLPNPKTQYIIDIHFGDSRYEHYKDTTPNPLYSHLDHLDEERRRRYIKRFENNPSYNTIYSPLWFSTNFLW